MPVGFVIGELKSPGDIIPGKSRFYMWGRNVQVVVEIKKPKIRDLPVDGSRR